MERLISIIAISKTGDFLATSIGQICQLVYQYMYESHQINILHDFCLYYLQWILYGCKQPAGLCVGQSPTLPLHVCCRASPCSESGKANSGTFLIIHVLIIVLVGTL